MAPRELEGLPSAFARFMPNCSRPGLVAAGKSQLQSHQSEDRKPAPHARQVTRSAEQDHRPALGWAHYQAVNKAESTNGRT